MKRLFLIVVLALLIFLIAVPLATLTTLDLRPYTEMEYYTQNLAAIEEAKQKFDTKGTSIQGAWSKESLLPPFSIPLAGYGDRKGAHMEGINDSLWVRAFVFDNGNHKVAMVFADLLTISNDLTYVLEKRLPEIGFDINTTYLTATHTHCSLGACYAGFVGEMFGGEYDQKIVDFIADQFLKAIQSAQEKVKPVTLATGKIKADKYVYNRLVGDQGTIDPWLRLVKISQEGGETAVLSTFAAHATCYSGRMMKLDRDYPGSYVDLLEADESIDFAAFAAGAVGSMGPEFRTLNDEMQIDSMAQGLYRKSLRVLTTLSPQSHQELGMMRVPLKLRSPHNRINDNLRIRPWLFRVLFGKTPTHISGLRLGPTVWLGMPCDFSGELVAGLKSNSPIFVTSFNGNYIGYITEDQWYNLREYETRLMNWFGPGNGAFFTEIMNEMLEKL